MDQKDISILKPTTIDRLTFSISRMNGLASIKDVDSFATPLVALGDLSVLTLPCAILLLSKVNFPACIFCASFGRSSIHFFSSMSEKKSDKRRSSAERVDFEPMMMSFFFARVKETLILRQSRSNSPICRQMCGLSTFSMLTGQRHSRYPSHLT